MAVTILPTTSNGGKLVMGKPHLNGDATPGVPAAAAGPKGMVLPFKPLHMTFKDLSYSINMPAVRANPFSNSITISISKGACLTAAASERTTGRGSHKVV